MAIPRTIPERSLPCAAHDLVKPAGGGTFFTRQESTQRGGLRGALAPASEANPLRIPLLALLFVRKKVSGFCSVLAKQNRNLREKNNGI